MHALQTTITREGNAVDEAAYGLELGIDARGLALAIRRSDVAGYGAALRALAEALEPETLLHALEAAGASVTEVWVACRNAGSERPEKLNAYLGSRFSAAIEDAVTAALADGI